MPFSFLTDLDADDFMYANDYYNDASKGITGTSQQGSALSPPLALTLAPRMLQTTWE